VYGFTQRPGRIFVHLLAGYEGSEFTTPAIDKWAVECRDVYRDRALEFAQQADGHIVIRGIDRAAHPADTVVSIALTSD
jgi:alpha-L-fucosidase